MQHHTKVERFRPAIGSKPKNPSPPPHYHSACFFSTASEVMSRVISLIYCENNSFQFGISLLFKDLSKEERQKAPTPFYLSFVPPIPTPSTGFFPNSKNFTPPRRISHSTHTGGFFYFYSLFLVFSPCLRCWPRKRQRFKLDGSSLYLRAVSFFFWLPSSCSPWEVGFNKVRLI